MEHLKVFGYMAHAKVPSAHTKKLDDRSTAMVYLGTEPGSKAYRLYDPRQHKLHVSRDVVFEKRKLWDWSKGIEANKDFSVEFSLVDNAGENNMEASIIDGVAAQESSPACYSQDLLEVHQLLPSSSS